MDCFVDSEFDPNNILEPTENGAHSLDLEEDLFNFEHQDLQHNYDYNLNTFDVDENSIFECKSALTQSLDTLLCSNLENNDQDGNYLTMLTDTNSSESSCQQSNCGSDSTNLNYMHDIDGRKIDWRMSETTKSQKGGFKCASSSSPGSEDGTDTTRFNIDYEADKRSYSLGNSYSKNAIAARDNRLKKKKYVSNLEESVRNLRTENEQLQEQSNKTSRTVSELQNEVLYLRSVIANQSVLSSILNNVVKTPGIKLSTSFHNSTLKNNHLRRRLTKEDNDNVSVNIGDTSVCAEHDQVNYVSRSNQNASSSILSRNNLAKNVQRKTVQSCERMRSDQAKEKHFNIDNSGESCTSSVSSAGNVSGGICLHITGQSVSLELCSHCNTNACLGIMSDHSYVKQ